MYKDVTGIILSGGKSSRMGQNKSLLKVGDKTIIERVRDLMKSLFPEVILITNELDIYKFLNLPSYEDVYTYKGPLAGIHSGLVHSSNETNFIISCDIPFINPEMIKYIIDFKTEKVITIAKADGYIQQLAGKYSMGCLNTAEEILEEYVNLENRNNDQVRRRCNVLKLIDKVGAEIISAESLTFYKKELFFNMNKVDDYNLLLERLSLADQNQN